MLRFIIRRVVVIIPMLFIIVSITWGLIRLAPGNFYTEEKKLAPGDRAEPAREVWTEQALVRAVSQSAVEHGPF